MRSFKIYGGGKQDRTADLLHAMQALSQLSYTPELSKSQNRIKNLTAKSVLSAKPQIIVCNLKYF